jgi:AraC family transcriptional regulator of adaptative response / DNA-3-methyladenine glycosylase II
MITALQARDARYARRFIVAVKTTKIYCVPGCPAPPPKPENVNFVASPEEARALGCRACKRCHPDQAFFGIPPDEGRYEALLREVNSNPERFDGVEAMAKEAGVGLSRFHVGIRETFHRTPLDLLTAAKVARAARLLLEPGASAGEVALEAGFTSSSVFYQQFGKATGLTPAAFGRLRTEREFRMELPTGYPAEAFVSYLSRDPQDPLCLKTDSGFTMRLESGSLFQFKVCSGGIDVLVENVGDAPAAQARLARLAALGAETSVLEALPAAAKLVERFIGLRVFQTVDIFDAVVWAIVGQQLTLSFAMKLRRRLYDLLSTGPHPWAPLTATQVRSVKMAALIEMQYSSRKAEYLLEAASRFEGLSDEEMHEWSSSRMSRYLEACRGFGPWSTNYVLMRGCGFADCVPVGDSGLATALHRFYGLEARPGPQQQAELMAAFQPYRSLATFHLWHSLKVVA